MQRREVIGEPDASGLRIAIAVSEFNAPITAGLLEGATAALEEAGCEAVDVVWVPGAFELPLIAKQLGESDYDAVVALGAVIEGETDHYAHISAQAAAGLMQASLEARVPVTFGVLMVRDAEHAAARSKPGPGNKGAEAAWAAVKAAQVLRQIS